jgi:hypothetical protein
MNTRLLSFMNCLLLVINRELLQSGISHYFIIKISKFMYFLIENNLIHFLMIKNFEVLLLNLLLILLVREF